MTNMTTKHVGKAWMLTAAESIEQSARESLSAWIVLGQTDKYTAAMDKVSTLRRAAEVQSVSIRRDMLRNAGII